MGTGSPSGCGSTSDGRLADCTERPETRWKLHAVMRRPCMPPCSQPSSATGAAGTGPLTLPHTGIGPLIVPWRQRPFACLRPFAFVYVFRRVGLAAAGCSWLSVWPSRSQSLQSLQSSDPRVCQSSPRQTSASIASRAHQRTLAPLAESTSRFQSQATRVCTSQCARARRQCLCLALRRGPCISRSILDKPDDHNIMAPCGPCGPREPYRAPYELACHRRAAGCGVRRHCLASQLRENMQHSARPGLSS